MKELLMSILIVMFTGCGTINRAITSYTGDLTYKCSKSGVEYVQSDSGLSIHVDISGQPIKCNQK